MVLVDKLGLKSNLPRYHFYDVKVIPSSVVLKVLIATNIKGPHELMRVGGKGNKEANTLWDHNELLIIYKILL